MIIVRFTRQWVNNNGSLIIPSQAGTSFYRVDMAIQNFNLQCRGWHESFPYQKLWIWDLLPVPIRIFGMGIPLNEAHVSLPAKSIFLFALTLTTDVSSLDLLKILRGKQVILPGLLGRLSTWRLEFLHGVRNEIVLLLGVSILNQSITEGGMLYIPCITWLSQLALLTCISCEFSFIL